jgi:ligand-binding SRPBCC domain-containing protein
MHSLTHSITVPFDIDETFSFFNRPENLSKVTPKSLHFYMMTPPPITMQVGAVFDYSIRLGVIPLHWRSLITEYRPPFEFVDIQLKGPYKFWHHRHSFESVDGGTKVTDTVHYDLGFGVFGKVINYLVVRHQLASIFSFRDSISENISLARKQFLGH